MTRATGTATRRADGTDEVTRFLHALRRVPLADWQRCAHVAVAARGSVDEVLLACALDGVPRVQARIGRRVAHLLAACDGLVPPNDVELMRTAACRAAGALAVRPLIGGHEFTRCYAPFARLVPCDGDAGTV